MSEPKQFSLTVEDRRTRIWASLKDQFEARLTVLRSQLERDGTEQMTANLRGRIAEIKSLMALDKDLPN